MIRRFVLGALLVACHGTREAPHDAAPPPPVPVVVVDAGTDAAVAAPSPKPLVEDAAFGKLVATLSENPGDFPSENYVTNETSLLHVASTVSDPALHGRAYVGVGPEQSYTYLAAMDPSVAYIVDIRRNNLVEHLVFRGCFEAGSNRAEFLSALLSRNAKTDVASADGFSALDDAFHTAPVDKDLRDAGVARTKALFDRLGIVKAPGDDAAIARIHDAFAKNGLAIAYTMLNSGRKYPTLAENFAVPGNFMSTEALYAKTRTIVRENRVIPVVGDFGGTHALRAVADDMKARNQELGIFYTSNVEQYLFEQKTYGEFVKSVDAMPHDASSKIIRVWFDQGHPHPQQQKGHRTTQLVFGVDAFLEQNAKKPFRSYWDVVTQAQ